MLIIKDAHHPVTVRITRRFGFTLLIIIALLLMFSLAAAGLLLHRTYQRTPPETIAEKPIESEIQLIEQNNDSDAETIPASEPEVTGLEINETDNGSIEIEFTLNNIPVDNELYVWIIATIGSETSGELKIHPRSPIFRGLPVDFRNGIRYHHNQNGPLKAVFTGTNSVTDVEQIRILAYSPAGNFVIDKKYTVR